MLTIENIIQKDGFYIAVAEGSSMFPLIRSKLDTVAVEKLDGECKPMDVVLYRMPSGKHVLHRVIAKHGDEYLICGDNCIGMEHVDASWILGRMTHFYHGERRIDLSSIPYRFYVLLWCRPYHFRIWILRMKHKLRQKIRRKKNHV